MTIATATVNIPAGTSRRVTFKLNAAGSKLLRAKRTLTATVTLTIDYGGPTTLNTTYRVVLRAPERLRKPNAAAKRQSAEPPASVSASGQ